MPSIFIVAGLSGDSAFEHDEEAKVPGSLTSFDWTADNIVVDRQHSGIVDVAQNLLDTVLSRTNFTVPEEPSPILIFWASDLGGSIVKQVRQQEFPHSIVRMTHLLMFRP